MQRGDVAPGDDVKIAKSGQWVEVMEIDCDGVTGRVLRFRVRPCCGREGRVRWVLSSSISMVEKARKETK